MTDNKDKRDYHLALAGCLYSANVHLGRYLESAPSESSAQGIATLRECVEEFIRFHEAVAKTCEPKGEVVSLDERRSSPPRTNSCPQRWADDEAQHRAEVLRRHRREE